jgi:ribosomal protein S18 acetylase RimI-like enzyme
VITIEKLDAGRWQDYRDLRLEALQSDPLAFIAAYEELKTYSTEHWQDRVKNALFAMDNDKPVGMIVYVRNGGMNTNHIAEIYGFYVTKNYRGRGIGKKLIDAALAEIQKLEGVTKIKIDVNPTQKAAKHLYRKCGFKKAGFLKKEVRHGDMFYDEIVMEKYL